MCNSKITLMKYLAFLLLLTSPLLVKSQSTRSEVLKKVSHLEYKNNKLIQSDTVIVQINERMGDADAKFNIWYRKGDKVTIGNSWIEDMSGNVIRKLKNKEVEDISAVANSTLYSDDFVKKFELKHNIYPYRIICTYKKVYDKIFWISMLDYTNRRQSVLDGTMIVDVPVNEEIKYEQKYVDAPQMETLGPIKRYTWKYSYTGVTPEKNTLYSTARFPQITVLPLHFKYGKSGSWESWQTFGNWIAALNDDRGFLPDGEKEKIRTLIADAKTDLEKIKILYTYLQDVTRYVNIRIDIGGLQAYPAEYVSVNKYGDCKALTNYMQAILREGGVKSYYTLINSSEYIEDVDPIFPSQAFNHAILTVPQENDTLFLECTSKNLAFGYVHSNIQGRQALLVDDNNSRLIATPSLKKEDVLCSRTIHLTMNISDMSKVDLKSTQRGDQYEESSWLKNSIHRDKAEKYIRNSILRGSYELLNFNLIDSKESPTIILEAECSMQHAYKQYGKNLILESFPIEMISYEIPEKRTQDVEIAYPSFYQDTIVYELENHKLAKIPADLSIESDFGHYSLSYKQDENKLITYKSILISAGRYPLSVYKDFYQFINDINNKERQKIYIEVQ